MTIPLDDQIAEVAREVAMRRNVYRKWVASGKMKQVDSDKQIERMEGALKTLEWLRKNKVDVMTGLLARAELDDRP